MTSSTDTRTRDRTRPCGLRSRYRCLSSPHWSLSLQLQLPLTVAIVGVLFYCVLIMQLTCHMLAAAAAAPDGTALNVSRVQDVFEMIQFDSFEMSVAHELSSAMYAEDDVLLHIRRKAFSRLIIEASYFSQPYPWLIVWMKSPENEKVARTAHHSCYRDDKVFIAFRGSAGSSGASDILTSLRSLPSFSTGGHVHSGFLNRTVQFPITSALNAILKQCREHNVHLRDWPRVIFTGHSLGGAVAQLAALRTLNQMPSADIEEARFFSLVFAAPEVADLGVTKNFVAKYKQMKENFLNIVNGNDPIPFVFSAVSSYLEGTFTAKETPLPAEEHSMMLRKKKNVLQLIAEKTSVCQILTGLLPYVGVPAPALLNLGCEAIVSPAVGTVFDVISPLFVEKVRDIITETILTNYHPLGQYLFVDSVESHATDAKSTTPSSSNFIFHVSQNGDWISKRGIERHFTLDAQAVGNHKLTAMKNSLSKSGLFTQENLDLIEYQAKTSPILKSIQSLALKLHKPKLTLRLNPSQNHQVFVQLQGFNIRYDESSLSEYVSNEDNRVVDWSAPCFLSLGQSSIKMDCIPAPVTFERGEGDQAVTCSASISDLQVGHSTSDNSIVNMLMKLHPTVQVKSLFGTVSSPLQADQVDAQRPKLNHFALTVHSFRQAFELGLNKLCTTNSSSNYKDFLSALREGQVFIHSELYDVFKKSLELVSTEERETIKRNVQEFWLRVQEFLVKHQRDRFDKLERHLRDAQRVKDDKLLDPSKYEPLPCHLSDYNMKKLDLILTTILPLINQPKISIRPDDLLQHLTKMTMYAVGSATAEFVTMDLFVAAAGILKPAALAAVNPTGLAMAAVGGLAYLGYGGYNYYTGRDINTTIMSSYEQMLDMVVLPNMLSPMEQRQKNYELLHGSRKLTSEHHVQLEDLLFDSARWRRWNNIGLPDPKKLELEIQEKRLFEKHESLVLDLNKVAMLETLKFVTHWIFTSKSISSLRAKVSKLFQIAVIGAHNAGKSSLIYGLYGFHLTRGFTKEHRTLNLGSYRLAPPETPIEQSAVFIIDSPGMSDPSKKARQLSTVATDTANLIILVIDVASDYKEATSYINELSTTGAGSDSASEEAKQKLNKIVVMINKVTTNKAAYRNPDKTKKDAWIRLNKKIALEDIILTRLPAEMSKEDREVKERLKIPGPKEIKEWLFQKIKQKCPADVIWDKEQLDAIKKAVTEFKVKKRAKRFKRK